MKYICLGYLEPGKFEGMTEAERHAVLDECFENNDHLRANGHLVTEVSLQPPETALTLYWKNAKVMTTDGPYAETKEQVGGIQILEARDLNHAVQLVSQQPGFKYGLGPIEIRPIADLTEMMKESERRRRRKDRACSHLNNLAEVESSGAQSMPESETSQLHFIRTDFLMHDVGTGDGILQATREHCGNRVFQTMSGYLSKQDFESSRNKIRAPPLWGVRLRPRLMHDGASLTFRDAILRHQGEASHVIQQFGKLKRDDQEAIIEFLKSL